MDSTFDIFKLAPEGPRWMAAMRGLKEANQQMALLVRTSPGEYFVRVRGQAVETEQSEEWAEVT